MSYSYFADYYDGLTENVDYRQKADYLLRLFERYDHQPGLTLDLACGTGSLTVELKKRGVDIFGADASSDMLSHAQMKAYDEELEILFLHRKMQELELFGKINTCICTLDSINHITSKKDLSRAFERVSLFLEEDGLFVFDANTVYKHKEILGDNCYIYDTDKVFCAWQNNYNEKNHKVIITLDFFEPDGKKYRRSSEQFAERAYTHDEMTEMLASAGLEIAAIYGDMSFDPPAEDSQREIYLVRKMRK